jgi:DNA-directed RNA polymerase specialized sigma24 family protein
MREGPGDRRREAFGDLAAGYWKPLYTYLRLSWQLSPDEAQDLTQSFFTEAFEKGWLERYDPARARFRTFVRVCADRLVMNQRQAAGRLKRGGDVDVVALDFDSAERELRGRLPATPPEADEMFRQEFVRALFARAVEDVRAECESAGRMRHFALFERYDLQGDDRVSYADLAREFGLTTTQVTNALAQVRRLFRARALEALRALSGSEEHFRDEARELFGVEV